MAPARKSLKFNFIMNAILTMSSFVFPLISFPYVSRILLPEGMGKVAFATSVISYFSLFAQLGIPTYGVRACAQVRDDREALTRTAHELLAINLFVCILTYGALALSLAFVPRLHEEKALYVILSTSIFLTAIGMEWLYKALEQYRYITVRSILFKFLALAAMFLLIHTEEDYVIYGGITILASSASNFLNFCNAHKFIGMRPIGRYHLRRHWKPAFIFFAMVCAATIYTNMDTVMLGFIKTDADVGYYNAAVKIKSVLLGVVTSLGTVMLPRVSYYIEQGMTMEFNRVCKKALNFVFLLATPLTVYFILFAKEGIFFLSGPAYDRSILPMQILMPTLLLIGLTNIVGMQILVPLGREKTVLYSTVAGAVVNVIMNAVLIPRYAASGAAVGTLTAEFVVLVFQYAALKGKTRELFRCVSYGRLLLSIAVASVVTLAIRDTFEGYFMILFSSAMVFFGVYGIVLILTREPLASEVFADIMDKLVRKAGKKDV